MFGPMFARKAGEIQPGIKLPIFNLVFRLPFIHYRFEWPIMFKDYCYVRFV